MIINSVKFKNIKSYGNRLTEIKFDSVKPELILLTGKNGAGKSTIQESIDLAVFGKVRGKNKKSIPHTHLPNRMNRGLEVEVDFININGQNVKIRRCIDPTSFDIKLNGISITNRFNIMDDVKKEEIIGFNYDMYKSFISMNINDFLNFIELQKSDKQNILNKLGDLYKLNSYISIAKDINKNLTKQLDALNLEKTNVNNSIVELESAINSINNNITSQIKERQSSIKVEANTLTTEKNSIKIQIEDYTTQYSNTTKKINDLKNELLILSNDKKVIDSDIIIHEDRIKLYEMGKCPTCSSDLCDDTHINMRNDIENNLNALRIRQQDKNNAINDIKNKGALLVVEKNNIIKTRDTLSNKYNFIINKLKTLKIEYETLQRSTTYSVDELKVKIDELKLKSSQLDIKCNELSIRITNIENLIKTINDEGIKKHLIKNLVVPINNNIKEYLKLLNFKYSIMLDDEFNAKIMERGTEINPQTLSNGETKTLNIIIALSYIKLIRSVRKMNVLFLDEVFVSLDGDNIQLFLNLLKKISVDLGINIIIIHHGVEEIDMNIFDKIVEVTNIGNSCSNILIKHS